MSDGNHTLCCVRALTAQHNAHVRDLEERDTCVRDLKEQISGALHGLAAAAREHTDLRAEIARLKAIIEDKKVVITTLRAERIKADKRALRALGGRRLDRDGKDVER